MKFIVARDRHSALKQARAIREGRLSKKLCYYTVSEAQQAKAGMKKFDKGVLRIFQIKV